MGTAQIYTALLPTVLAGWLMVWVGFGKRRLERRPQECRRCHRRSCICASRR